MLHTKMKTKWILCFALILLANSCQNISIEDTKQHSSEEEMPLATVDLNCALNIDETKWNLNTRATASESSATRIAVKIFDSSNQEVTSITQQKTDENFGSIRELRLSPGSYTIVAVAHKASSTESEAPKITSPTSATIPETVLDDVYACVTPLVIEEGNYGKKTVNMTLNLCVTSVRVHLEDELPSTVKKLQLTVNAGQAAFTSLVFNPTTSLAVADASYTRTYSVENLVGNKIQFRSKAMFNVYPKTASIAVKALGENDVVLYSRQYDGIQLNRAKERHIYTYLFSEGVDSDMSFEEWGDDEPITIE